MQIFICKNERKKGYAQKAISLLENIMRNIYNIHQLYAFITEDNQKSIKLFEKSGYIFTSSLKDWVLTNSKYKNVNVYQKIF